MGAVLKNWEGTSVQQTAIRGTPDRYECINGWMVVLEFKSEDGEPTRLQLHKMQKIRENGKGVAILVEPENADIVLEQLIQIDQGEPPCLRRKI